MGTYKVIQDVEAEDKILGPLTLRQFVYAGIAAICFYLTYFVSSHGAGFLAAGFIPVALIAAFFAFPWGRDQPTEIWALAKIRFMLKPRRRIWDQSGAKELVTITAPKQVHLDYTNGLSENEVQSRLHALADTIDSRGWAIKNSNVNVVAQPLMMGEPASDRLLSMSSLPQPVAAVEIGAADDMLDESANPRARQMETMIAASAKAHRQKIIDTLEAPEQIPAPTPPVPAAAPQAPANNYWFLNQPTQPANIPADMVTFNTQVVTPGMAQAQPASMAPPAPVAPAADEATLVRELEAHRQQMPDPSYYGHLHTVQPLSAQHSAPMPPPAQPITPIAPAPAAPAPTAQAAGPTPPPPLFVTTVAAAPAAPTPPPAQVTPANQAAILQLANNNDLNVATLAREAHRAEPGDEVIIKLH